MGKKDLDLEREGRKEREEGREKNFRFDLIDDLSNLMHLSNSINST